MRDINAKMLEDGTPTPSIVSPVGDLDARALLLVPMLAGERVLEVITLVMSRRVRHCEAADRQIAQEAASTIENARLYESAQKAIRHHEEALAIVSHDLLIH